MELLMVEKIGIFMAGILVGIFLGLLINHDYYSNLKP